MFNLLALNEVAKREKIVAGLWWGEGEEEVCGVWQQGMMVYCPCTCVCVCVYACAWYILWGPGGGGLWNGGKRHKQRGRNKYIYFTEMKWDSNHVWNTTHTWNFDDCHLLYDMVQCTQRRQHRRRRTKNGWARARGEKKWLNTLADTINRKIKYWHSI